MTAIESFAQFVTFAEIPDRALAAARDAVQDTVGVMLAGVAEPSTRILQTVARAECPDGPASIIGTPMTTGAGWAALVNGTAAHALDFDDMCWVTLAHPSAPLVAAGLAVGEVVGGSGRTLLESYVAGFEVEAVLGQAMNPSHYARGWHATSTIGSVGATAVAARIMGLDMDATGRALPIAASEASGLKENFGTMVKPLQAGLAARNGVLAAALAQEGLTASEHAIDGAQGFLIAMGSERDNLGEPLTHLGRRWEIIDGGITVKLYPSCAATHPTIDTLLDLRREHSIEPGAIEAVNIAVDAVTPTVLIYDQPTTGLEGKFSLHFCAAAALVHGRVGIDTFELPGLDDPAVRCLQPLVTMVVDETLGKSAPPLTQAHVQVRLRDGRQIERSANGARGYPHNPVTRDELDGKFRDCAARTVPARTIADALDLLRALPAAGDVRRLGEVLACAAVGSP